MYRSRIADSVQGTYKTSDAVNLVFFEPSILLKEEPVFEDENTHKKEQHFRSLMAKEFKHCKQHIGVSDIIPVIPLPVCMTVQLTQSSRVPCSRKFNLAAVVC